jgi:hypothetical protein
MNEIITAADAEHGSSVHEYFGVVRKIVRMEWIVFQRIKHSGAINMHKFETQVYIDFMRTLLILCVSLTGCYREWDFPAAPPKHQYNNCVRVVNGRYLYNDSCEVRDSESYSVLPP